MDTSVADVSASGREMSESEFSYVMDATSEYQKLHAELLQQLRQVCSAKPVHRVLRAKCL